MARLRWMENARTGDKGTVCTHSNKLFFKDTGAYINCDASDTLILHGDTKVYIDGDLDVSGGLSYGSEVVSLAQTLGGYLTVGAADVGFNVIFHGTGSSHLWSWIADSSSGGVIMVGAFDITGNMTIDGDISDITGTLGVSGKTTLAAVDIVGIVDITGAVAQNGDITMDAQHYIHFDTSGASIQASGTDTLALTASTAITIAATDITLAGILTFTGAPTVSGTATFNGLVECESRLGVGGTANATTLVAGTPTFEVWTTCSTANTTTAVNSYFNAVMTYATGRGRAIEAVLTTNVALGDWANAIKGYFVIESSGSVSGLGSAICAELKLPASALTLGSYGVLELELYCTASYEGTIPVGFIWAQSMGDSTAMEYFDDYGYLMIIKGLGNGTGNILYDNTLRILVGSTEKYIPLSSTQRTLTITLTDPSAPASTIYAVADVGAAYTPGSVNAIKGYLTSDCPTGDVGNQAAGWFGLNWTSAQNAMQLGVTRALNAEVVNDCGTHPSAIVYLQSIPGTNADHSGMPYIVFTEVATGTGSNILFELGFGPSSTTVTSGTSGNLLFHDTIHIVANDTDMYLPMSSVEGTFTTAYPISQTIAALTAGDAYSGIRCAVTADNPNNAYGASGYFQADITGTQSAHFYGFGSWVNIANAAIGGGAGKYLCAQDNGIYVDTPGGEWANTLVVFGMRAECIGLDSDTKRFPFSINTGGTYGLTALFDVNSLDEMSRIASATEQSEYVPIFRTSAGDMRYVRLYTAD